MTREALQIIEVGGTGKVEDILVNGESVLDENGIANIEIPEQKEGQTNE